MDKVVYFLGAGFSAAFGIPVMSNFLETAKDLYFSDRNRFGDLGAVIERINQYAVVKNTFDADLFNIEEIMSLLQIEHDLGNGMEEDSFTAFIIRVIKESTPKFRAYTGGFPNNWYTVLFEQSTIQNELANFVLNLLGTQTQVIPFDRGGGTRALQFQNLVGARRAARYGVVTLNYDILLETVAAHIRSTYDESHDFSAQFASPSDSDDPWECANAMLVKLHGCVQLGNVVPPTWKKGVNATIEAHWRAAFRMIAEANHIRIIGYSLATADSYIKYLMKAAVVGNPHLKTITVICRDPSGEIERRFRDFVVHPGFVFLNSATEDYLHDLSLNPDCPVDDRSRVYFNQLEAHHESFLKQHGFARR